MKYAVSVMVAMLGLAGCASNNYIDSRAQATRGDLKGMVYDLDRRPVAHVRVSLEGTSKKATTDIHGHFSMADVGFGPLKLLLEKEGYEPFHWAFDYGEISQVVYVQMADADQLFDAVASAMDAKLWAQAKALLDRAVTLAPERAAGVFFRATLAAQDGRPQDAVSLVEAYLAKKPGSYTLELLAADLYEQKLQSPDQALIHLSRALAIRYDPEVDLRIRKLRGESGD